MQVMQQRQKQLSKMVGPTVEGPKFNNIWNLCFTFQLMWEYYKVTLIFFPPIENVEAVQMSIFKEHLSHCIQNIIFGATDSYSLYFLYGHYLLSPLLQPNRSYGRYNEHDGITMVDSA